jgi:hypothetical protein
MQDEGRQHERAEVNWPVTIHTEEGTIERATYNISPWSLHPWFVSP